MAVGDGLALSDSDDAEEYGKSIVLDTGMFSVKVKTLICVTVAQMAPLHYRHRDVSTPASLLRV